MGASVNPVMAELQQLTGLLKNKSALTRGFMKASAPRLLRGAVMQTLAGKSNEDIFNYLMGDFWEQTPENVQSFLESYKPWDLQWFTVEWVAQTVAMVSPAMGTAIASSPSLIESVQKNIDSLKQLLS